MKRLITVAALAVALVAPGGPSPAEATGHAKRSALARGAGTRLAGTRERNASLPLTGQGKERL